MSIVAIVGRPNVGKSTLFNRIGKKRAALVDDRPGVTRDRIMAEVQYLNHRFTLVDTAGFVEQGAQSLSEQTRRQVLMAIEEADAIVFLVDGKAGLHPTDQDMVKILRCSEKNVFYAVNKIDGKEQEVHVAEFYGLGVDRLFPLIAAHGYGVSKLLDDLVAVLPVDEDAQHYEDNKIIRIAVVGRPNVGKSTLVNKILGEERLIVSPAAGTTRDAVDTYVEHDGQRFMIIDTAGIRKRGRTKEKLEKLSILKALNGIERCHVALILVDAVEGVTDQDLHIAGYVQDRYRACLIGINKWDRLTKDAKTVRRYLDEVRYRFRFISHAPLVTLSALRGTRVHRLLPLIREMFDQFNTRVGTGKVNRILAKAVERHEPHLVGGRRVKFYYATQPSTRPPTFVIFCNFPDRIHFSYQRYLANQFREAFGMDRTPIRLLFRPRRQEGPAG